VLIFENGKKGNFCVSRAVVPSPPRGIGGGGGGMEETRKIRYFEVTRSYRKHPLLF